MAKNPTTAQVDAIMRKLTEQDTDGGRWGAIKLGGYWVISYTTDPSVKWNPIFGAHGQETSRSFARALLHTTGCTDWTVI